MTALPSFDRADHSQALARLSERLPGRLVTSRAVRDQHAHSEGYGPVAAPDAVLFAQSTEDVVEALAFCSAHGVPVVPHGAGTSLEGHLAAVRGGLSVDLTRMDRILRVSAEDLDCTVEAGVTREALNAHLRDCGLFFPIDPGANATLGGMASTRASGTNAVRYGTLKEAVLALKVVLPDGRVITTGRRARKSAAGYDLTRLFVGAEGTLGIITEVTLRLHGIPETIASAVCAFESLEGAVRSVIEIIQLGVPVARVELLDDTQIRACNRLSGTTLAEQPTLFLEFHGGPRSVAEQVETSEAVAAGNGGGRLAWSTTSEERTRLWKARHAAYHAAKALRPNARVLVTDVCVPIAALATCILETRADIDRLGLLAPIVGHVGDGNFHVLVVVTPDDPDLVERVEAFNRALVDRALRLEGTCTGEHGVGLGKRDKLLLELGPDAVDLMRTIKRAIDPAGIMNPEKIFAA